MYVFNIFRQNKLSPISTEKSMTVKGQANKQTNKQTRKQTMNRFSVSCIGYIYKE